MEPLLNLAMFGRTLRMKSLGQAKDTGHGKPLAYTRLSVYKQAMRDLAIALGALADPTRLEMLALLLRHNELCVCDFVGTLGISQSKASRHLRYMWNARLLDDRRAGLWVYYRIARQLDAERAILVKALGKVFDARDLRELEGRHAVWLKAKAKSMACALPVARSKPAQELRKLGGPRAGADARR